MHLSPLIQTSELTHLLVLYWLHELLMIYDKYFTSRHLHFHEESENRPYYYTLMSFILNAHQRIYNKNKQTLKKNKKTFAYYKQ